MECVRGSATITLVVCLFGTGLLVLVAVYCAVAMYAIYRDIRNIEVRMDRYSFGEEHRRESRRIRTMMLLYTGSFFLCWILPIIIILIKPLNGVPAFRIVVMVISPLQGLFNMVIFFRPKCLKYQKDNPGTILLVAYARVVIGTPAWVKAVMRMFSSLQTRTQNTKEDEDVDDGIGFGNYNEEPTDTQDASGLNEVAVAESDVPPNDR